MCLPDPGVSEKPLVNVSIWDVLKARDELQVPLPAFPCSLMRMLSCPGHFTDSWKLGRRCSPQGGCLMKHVPVQEEAQARFWACEVGKQDFAADFILHLEHQDLSMRLHFR